MDAVENYAGTVPDECRNRAGCCLHAYHQDSFYAPALPFVR